MRNFSKVALITGITGQDGSYLAEQLLDKGYVVHGLVRRSSVMARTNLDIVREGHPAASRNLQLHYGDVSDGSRMAALLADIRPDEVYNLAAQSHVRVSLDEPVHTTMTTAIGALNVLEAVRVVIPSARVFQAGSSEVFKGSSEPVNEVSIFQPRNPYGAARSYTHWITNVYREAYGLFTVSGLMFNHESPRRGESFVTRKITLAAAKIALGLQETLELGNVNVERDWGYAPEFTEAMWLSLQASEPRDYVLCTGSLTHLTDFLDAAFLEVGLEWQRYVTCDSRLRRPSDTAIVVGNPSKAESQLGWRAQTSGCDVARIMVRADLRRAEVALDEGHVTANVDVARLGGVV